MKNNKISRRDLLKGTAAAGIGAGLFNLPGIRPVNAQEPQRYIWLCAVTSVAFWIDGRLGMEAAGEALGVETEFLGPVEYDAAQQVQILEELIPTEPNGLMIFPADTVSLIDPMKRAMEAGIPVLTVNSDVADPTARYGFVGPDNRGIGRTGGELAAELINGSGRVAIMTVPGVGVHEERTAGYTEVFESYDGIEVVEIVNNQSDPAVGVTVGTQLIQANPDLDLIVGTDATAGASIARALLETGRSGDIRVVAMDRDNDLLQFIQQGVVDATLAQKSTLEMWLATHYLYWLSNNTIPAFDDWRAVNAPQVPVFTDTGVTIVTSENVDAYFK